MSAAPTRIVTDHTVTNHIEAAHSDTHALADHSREPRPPQISLAGGSQGRDYRADSPAAASAAAAATHEVVTTHLHGAQGQGSSVQVSAFHAGAYATSNSLLSHRSRAQLLAREGEELFAPPVFMLDATTSVTHVKVGRLGVRRVCELDKEAPCCLAGIVYWIYYTVKYYVWISAPQQQFVSDILVKVRRREIPNFVWDDQMQAMLQDSCFMIQSFLGGHDLQAFNALYDWMLERHDIVDGDHKFADLQKELNAMHQVILESKKGKCDFDQIEMQFPATILDTSMSLILSRVLIEGRVVLQHFLDADMMEAITEEAIYRFILAKEQGIGRRIRGGVTFSAQELAVELTQKFGRVVAKQVLIKREDDFISMLNKSSEHRYQELMRLLGDDRAVLNEEPSQSGRASPPVNAVAIPALGDGAYRASTVSTVSSTTASSLASTLTTTRGSVLVPGLTPRLASAGNSPMGLTAAQPSARLSAAVDTITHSLPGSGVSSVVSLGQTQQQTSSSLTARQIEPMAPSLTLAAAALDSGAQVRLRSATIPAPGTHSGLEHKAAHRN